MPIIIRPIEPNELPKTVDIYLDCIRTDYNFMPQHYLNTKNQEDELAECKEWLYRPDGHPQIFAAMDSQVMAGYIALSQNTAEPMEYEGEVNGFFIRKEYRAQGIGLMLLRRGLEYFQELGYTGLVIYNYRISAANAYYRMLGGKVVKQEIQTAGGMELETDIFGYKIDSLMNVLNQNLEKYV
jgi:GNAT superfamily N-acetyltransferase